MGERIKKVPFGVVIVAYNSEAVLANCLNSVADSECVPGIVVVIENRSLGADAAFAIVSDCYPSAIFIRMAENVGFGRANNLGIAFCLEGGCDFVTIMNPDVIVKQDTFCTMLSTFEDKSELALLGGVELNYNNNEPNSISKRFISSAISENENIIVSNMEKGAILSGSLLMFRRKKVLYCGAFDPIYFMYFEDHDMLSRWIEYGAVLAINPKVRYHHAVSHSYSSNSSHSNIAIKIRHYSRSRFIHAISNSKTPLVVNFIRIILELSRGVWEYLFKWDLMKQLFIGLFETPFMLSVKKGVRDRQKDTIYYSNELTASTRTESYRIEKCRDNKVKSTANAKSRPLNV